MNYCRICNHEISYGEKFCPICGEKTPYYNQSVNQNVNQSVNQGDFKPLNNQINPYFNVQPQYYDKNETAIKNMINTLILAMVCISIKFAIDILTYFGQISDAYSYEFHLSHVSFVFEYVVFMAIIISLKVILSEMYTSLKNKINNLKN